jgi:Co/Zn/Cd efflux system component
MIKFIPHTDPITGEEINLWLKYIDPLLTLIMVVIIAIRAIPVIISLSEILIENVPGGIDTNALMNEIIINIPEIKSIHSLHVWRYNNKKKEVFLKEKFLYILEQQLKKFMQHYILYVMKI